MTENDSQKVEVTIKKEGNSGNESENVEQLKAQLENETIIREDLEAKLKLIGEQKINEKIKEYGIPESEQQFFRENPEALKGYRLGKNSIKEDGGRGTLGLSPEEISKEQIGNAGSNSYNSPEELAKDVCQKASEGDKEMQAVKQKLWEKMVAGWKENPVQTLNHTYVHPNMIKDTLEVQNRKWRKERGCKE